MAGAGTRGGGLVTAIVDLVLPQVCAGCEAAGGPLRYEVCDRCRAALDGLRPGPARPQPPPAGLPPGAALGEYTGVLRELLLAYKDRGRHRLGRPLGRLLAGVVAQLVASPARPVLLVPIPDAPAAARARHGDHLWRLTRSTVGRLRTAGYRVAAVPVLRCRPRPDSAGLDPAQRAAAAAALTVRPWAAARLRRRVEATGAAVVLVDDVMTTGATLAAAARRLAEAGIPVSGAAVLAATRLRRPSGPPRRAGGR